MKSKKIEHISVLIYQAREELKNHSLQLKDKSNLNVDQIIIEVNAILELKSIYLDLDELHSDLESLEYYYQKRSWNNVSRWLSNLDTTLKEIFSYEVEYEQLVKRKPIDIIEYSP